MSDVNELLAERGQNYGLFQNQASLSQSLKNTIMQHYFQTHGGDQADPLPAYLVEGISMICHKLARAANGNPYYIDNFKDISGYAELICKALEHQQQQNTVKDSNEHATTSTTGQSTEVTLG